MVSLYVTAIGYLVKEGTALQAYEILARHGYLSESALSARENVISLIERKRAAFPQYPAPGHESWRDVDVALEEAGYLSSKGLTEGRRSFTRYGREVGRPGVKSLLIRLFDWLKR